MDGVVEAADGEFEGEGGVGVMEFAAGVEEELGEGFGVGFFGEGGEEAFAASGGDPGEGGEEGVFLDGCPLADVDIEEEEVEPGGEAGFEGGEVPVDVPG